jgi:hypothetical protein
MEILLLLVGASFGAFALRIMLRVARALEKIASNSERIARSGELELAWRASHEAEL